VQLAPGLHLVASGSGGFDLTDRFDCHVYLVEGDGEAALVDAGIGSAVDDTLGNVAAAGVRPEAVRWVVLTHAHPDHSGGAAYLRERLPHVEIAASAEVARWVRDADEDAMSLEAGKRAEFYPRDFRFRGCPVEHELCEGESLRVGHTELVAVETPGHCDGHLSFIAEIGGRKALFSGDLVFHGGRISLVNTWDCRLQEYGASLRKLAGVGIELLLPGHHALALARGQRHVDAANRLFELGFVPRSIV
jgi:glyoxylase-like metal-dependent hydrolase (beta-lactamase superfamily II)